MILWSVELPLSNVSIGLAVNDAIARANPKIAGPEPLDVRHVQQTLANATGIEGHILPEQPTALELNSAIAKSFKSSKLLRQPFDFGLAPEVPPMSVS